MSRYLIKSNFFYSIIGFRTSSTQGRLKIVLQMLGAEKDLIVDDETALLLRNHTDQEELTDLILDNFPNVYTTVFLPHARLVSSQYCPRLFDHSGGSILDIQKDERIAPQDTVTNAML